MEMAEAKLELELEILRLKQVAYTLKLINTENYFTVLLTLAKSGLHK
jgi:hypothetical protein